MPKKRTHITKSDLKAKKPWLKKVKPSKYKIETDEPNKTILIVCEGQTEKLYFESFQVLSLSVKIIDLKGQSKLQLVKNTTAILKDETYDQVWCVFDLDINTEIVNCKADFDNAIKKAKQLGYEVAYSNDAFELWFYLHFRYTDQENHRKFYYKQLSNLWDINYEKLGKVYKFSSEIYKRLMNDKNASQKEAIKRANKLFNKQETLLYHKQNPVTLVYELVKELNKNLRR